MSRNTRSLEIGEKVFIGSSYGWSDQRYLSGVVTKITPTGRITVTRKGSAEYSTIFGKDWRELGNRFRGEWIDDMPYAERQAYIAQRERIDKAANALRQLAMEPQNYRTKESVDAEFLRLKAIFEEAEKLVKEI